ncbi:basic helix-loop-helix (bHLH) DNA-binding superfamily protein [Actinidia rufa]|uniref:Basic helix-loop-helix (BHLH) DNA-binding superfamily protein n=1 Tax=Actinidia rufa TaxID=165716 RepID=A0A7J0G413_9ERIC|nr:basic helix-loop-helix (bHLH) DNA-binding superfamily protein [Actinidia rufa]
MENDSSETSTWLFDYGLMEDISAVPGGDFTAAPACFGWPSQGFNSCSLIRGGVEIDCSFGDSESLKETGSRKRFLELGAVLEPGRPPKTDKGAILNDAVRVVTQLRSEAQKLKDSNEELQEKIKELKAEKNELRNEKQRLKTDKEKLEQQVKSMSVQPGYMPHPSAVPAAAFGAQGQTAGDKLMPVIGYPGVAMWQFIPPAVRDTSQDHVLRPPVA